MSKTELVHLIPATKVDLVSRSLQSLGCGFARPLHLSGDPESPTVIMCSANSGLRCLGHTRTNSHPGGTRGVVPHCAANIPEKQLIRLIHTTK